MSLENVCVHSRSGPKFSLEDDDEELTDIIVANGGGDYSSSRGNAAPYGSPDGSEEGSRGRGQNAAYLELAQRRQSSGGAAEADTSGLLRNGGAYTCLMVYVALLSTSNWRSCPVPPSWLLSAQ